MMKLWWSLVSLALLAPFVRPAAVDQGLGTADDFQSRQSNTWLCSAWIPVGVQTNMCRVFCFLFLNRVPSATSSSATSSSTKEGCSNGTCDCS